MWHLLYFLLFLVLLTAGYAGLKGAPWVPTRKRDVDRFLGVAGITPGMVMVDLGCGDGQLVIAAAKAGAIARGYEISIFPYILARLRVIFSGTDHATILFRDLWKVDLRDADLVYFFLMPDKIAALKEKFERELKPGAKVVAYVWPVKGWTPERLLIEPGLTNLYLYKR